ncbi:porin, partial [Vibrio anguillarum]
AIGDTGVKLGAGYADQDTAANASSDQYMLAASYAISDFYFAGTFVDGQDKAASKTDKTGYELAAKYTMGQAVFTST